MNWAGPPARQMSMNRFKEFIMEQIIGNVGKEEEYDRVNHPYHYTHGGPVLKLRCAVCDADFDVNLECIDVIRDMPTWKGNAVKYLWRAGLKSEEGMSSKEKEIEDLEKAMFYIQDRINILKKE